MDPQRKRGPFTAPKFDGPSRRDNVYTAARSASEDLIYVTQSSAETNWISRTVISAPGIPYLPAISSSSENSVVVGYQWHSNSNGNGSARLPVRASSNGGLNWTSESRRPSVFAGDGGLSSSYDPATGQWLFVMTGSDVVDHGRRIRFFTLFPGDVPDNLPDWTTGDVPSIACAGPEVVFNCMLTWQHDGWRPGVLYSFCRVISPVTGVGPETRLPPQTIA